MSPKTYFTRRNIIMKTNQLQNVESLHKFQTISYKNLETIDGGAMPPYKIVLIIGGALYATGEKIGKALYYATH